MFKKQKTIKNNKSFKGIGLHSGLLTTVTFKPLPENSGINFKRIDISDKVLKVSPFKVTQTTLNTTIEDEFVKVSTIEHLMCALAFLGIDNILIEIDSEEVPIMDGSAIPFIFMLKLAGITELKANKKFIKIKQSVSVTSEDKVATLIPYDGFILNFNIDFDHPFISNTNQSYSLDFNSKNSVNDIAKARTFGFLKDIEYLKTLNLCKGGDLNNAIVLNEFGMMNKDPLRYEDEFVRHKILDSIGDLYLEGFQIIGIFNGYKSGHDLNNKLIKELMSSEENYEIIEIKEDSESYIDDRLESLDFNTENLIEN